MDEVTHEPRRRPVNSRPRDRLGRPLPYGQPGVERQPEGVSRSPAQALQDAHHLLETAMPFHAHEVLEDAWKAAPADERDLWRGLAQLAVGATHAARGNRSGAIALLRRGESAVRAYTDAAPHHLDIEAIRRWCSDAVECVTRECPVDLPAPPLPTH